MKNNKDKIEKDKKYRFMFAIVSEDIAGQTIQLFKSKKQAEKFYSEIKKRLLK